MKGPLRGECSVASVRMWSRRGAADLTAEVANLAARRQSVDPVSLDAMVVRLRTEPRGDGVPWVAVWMQTMSYYIGPWEQPKTHVARVGGGGEGGARQAEWL